MWDTINSYFIDNKKELQYNNKKILVIYIKVCYFIFVHASVFYFGKKENYEKNQKIF